MQDKATKPPILLKDATDEQIRQWLIEHGWHGVLFKLPKGMKLEGIEGVDMRVAR